MNTHLQRIRADDDMVSREPTQPAPAPAPSSRAGGNRGPGAAVPHRGFSQAQTSPANSVIIENNTEQYSIGTSVEDPENSQALGEAYPQYGSGAVVDETLDVI